MSKDKAVEDDMKPEYDFSSGRVERGKFREFAAKSRATRVLSPELAARFPDDASVNAALLELLRLKQAS